MSFDQWIAEHFPKLMGHVQLLPEVLEKDKQQAEFTLPPWDYIDRLATNERSSAGKRYFVEFHSELNRIFDNTVFHLRCYWRFGALKQILVRPQAPFQLDQHSQHWLLQAARGADHTLLISYNIFVRKFIQCRVRGNLFVAAGLVRLGICNLCQKHTPNLGFHIALAGPRIFGLRSPMH